VLTLADRNSCFPHVKLNVESAKATGLFLFVSPLEKRTEENLFRKQLPFPLNIRLIYGNIIISFSKSHSEVLPMSVVQWQNIMEQWIGATTDQSIIHMHMHRNFNVAEISADEEKSEKSDEEQFSDEDYEIAQHNKEDYNDSIPEDTDDIVPLTDASDEDSDVLKEEEDEDMIEDEDDF
jgi:hypothetical protein